MLKIQIIRIVILKNCLLERKIGLIIAQILQVKSYGIDDIKTIVITTIQRI
jgi:hypothetical protein